MRYRIVAAEDSPDGIRKHDGKAVRVVRWLSGGAAVETEDGTGLFLRTWEIEPAE